MSSSPPPGVLLHPVCLRSAPSGPHSGPSAGPPSSRSPPPTLSSPLSASSSSLSSVSTATVAAKTTASPCEGAVSPARPSPATSVNISASPSAPSPPVSAGSSPPHTPVAHSPAVEVTAGAQAVSSSPSTPTPHSAVSSPTIGVRDESDREGVHHGSVDGLEYDAGWLDSLDVVGTVGGSSVRAISASDVAELDKRHRALDVPETALFPWLHGMGDGNPSLDAFFSAFPGVQVQFPAPRYRGLTIVRAPGPADAYSSSPPSSTVDTSTWAATDVGELGFRHRSDSLASSSESDPDCGGSSWTSSIASRRSTPSLSVSSSLSSDSSFESHRPSTDTASVPPTPSTNSCFLTSAVSAEEVITLPAPARPRYQRRRSSGGGSALLEQVLDKDIEEEPGRFIRRNVGESICLRNLSLQVAKYSTISDIIVYHPDGICSASLAIARRCAEAHESQYTYRCSLVGENQPPPVPYNVFVVSSPFSTFELDHPHLVGTDSQGVQRNVVDLFKKEKVQTSDLTRAVEIAPGFWLGNSNDCPLLGTEETQGIDELNYMGFDVCIEAYDSAQMPDDARLHHASSYLASIPQPRHRQRQRSHGAALTNSLSAIKLSPSSSPPVVISPLTPSPSTSGFIGHEDAQQMAEPDDLALPISYPDPSQIYHLMCLSTSIHFNNDWRAINVMAGDMLDLVRWVKKTADGGKRVLAYGIDGYTETSVLALTYIMLVHSLTLPEAYLHLHLESKRAFFVYPQDLAVLRRIEDRLAQDRRLRSAPVGHLEPAHAVHGQGKWKGGWGLSWSVPKEVQAAEDKKARDRVETIKRNSAWFNSPCFEGSFPSRIVDFLYLGNLNHASNPQMLHALGITHVVSVGESALVAPPPTPASQHPHSYHHHHHHHAHPSHPPAPNPQLYHEFTQGRIQVLDMQSICDDGVSPLRPMIAQAVEWIENARRSGGKILVHCKVGVSRSATVTIAYLMKHWGYSLIDAYMLTRARRLNVLIQPNLKFLYELQGWEVELSREVAEASLGLPICDSPSPSSSNVRVQGQKAMSWPVLTRDLAKLNQRYLG